jgi:hypothetical protein
MSTAKVYDPSDAQFLTQLISEMVAIPVRSRGESIALHVATRDLLAKDYLLGRSVEAAKHARKAGGK